VEEHDTVQSVDQSTDWYSRHSAAREGDRARRTCWWRITFDRQRWRRVLAKNDTRRFGFHNLRHSLASFLVRTKTDPKTVQALLRHSDVKTTLQLYAHSVSEDRMAAQGQALDAILHGGNTSVN
jgi:integrase